MCFCVSFSWNDIIRSIYPDSFEWYSELYPLCNVRWVTLTLAQFNYYHEVLCMNKFTTNTKQPIHCAFRNQFWTLYISINRCCVCRSSSHLSMFDHFNSLHFVLTRTWQWKWTRECKNCFLTFSKSIDIARDLIRMILSVSRSKNPILLCQKIIILTLSEDLLNFAFGTFNIFK